MRSCWCLMKEVAEVDISGVEKERIVLISVSGDTLAHKHAVRQVRLSRAERHAVRNAAILVLFLSNSFNSFNSLTPLPCYRFGPPCFVSDLVPHHPRTTAPLGARTGTTCHLSPPACNTCPGPDLPTSAQPTQQTSHPARLVRFPTSGPPSNLSHTAGPLLVHVL
jgi:hypothetical protein